MKRIPSLSFLAALLVLAVCSPLSAEPDIVGSMVKVYSQCYPYSYETPWLLAAEESGTGSGCIISGNRILTAAHVVANAKFIQVKRAGAKDKVEAEVEIVAHECDLAVLKVKDRSFFDGARPLDIGPLVDLRDRVTVYGFPEGGEELSTTEGIVSRIEVNSYAHSGARLLCSQIDAAINAGNSGGPVVKDGQMKNPLLVVSLVLLLCFTFGCQNKAEKAELEKSGAQAKLEEWLGLCERYRQKSPGYSGTEEQKERFGQYQNHFRPGSRSLLPAPVP